MTRAADTIERRHTATLIAWEAEESLTPQLRALRGAA
jgi:hypothetical protein